MCDVQLDKKACSAIHAVNLRNFLGAETRTIVSSFSWLIFAPFCYSYKTSSHIPQVAIFLVIIVIICAQSGYLSALKCLNMQEYPDKNFLLEQAMSQQKLICMRVNSFRLGHYPIWINFASSLFNFISQISHLWPLWDINPKITKSGNFWDYTVLF